jgi:invasion protein IalB
MTRRPTRGRAAAAICGLALALAAPSALLAQDAGADADANATGLPGGASSLTETHGDWTVSCRVEQQGDQSIRLCALSQQQANSQGQRTLAVELQPTTDEASGVLILPFGLAVAQGVTLRVGEEEPGQPLPFSTCLPVGCLVPITLDAARLDELGQGTGLDVTATAAGGGEVTLAIPLAGFTSALDRTRELME